MTVIWKVTASNKLWTSFRQSATQLTLVGNQLSTTLLSNHCEELNTGQFEGQRQLKTFNEDEFEIMFNNKHTCHSDMLTYLPPVATVVTQDKRRHWLISTESLHLNTTVMLSQVLQFDERLYRNCLLLLLSLETNFWNYKINTKKLEMF